MHNCLPPSFGLRSWKRADDIERSIEIIKLQGQLELVVGIGRHLKGEFFKVWREVDQDGSKNKVCA